MFVVALSEVIRTLSEVFQLLENDMSHGEKAQWLLSSIFLPTSKVTLKLCFLQALGFSKGAHMHLFTCHKYRDTFLLLSDKNPGKSQSKAKLLLHQQSPWKACQITLCEWVWRWCLNCWDLGEGGEKSYTLAASSTQVFLLLTLIFLEFYHCWKKSPFAVQKSWRTWPTFRIYRLLWKTKSKIFSSF